MILDLLSGNLRAPAECTITVDGEEIADLYPFLTEVGVDTARSKPATATLRFESRRDEQGRYTVQDSGLLEPWRVIAISAVFGLETQEIMRGYIREVRADYPQDPGESAVTVECQDVSVRLDREHVRKTWGGDAPTSDRLIVTTILGRYDLALDPQSGDGLGNLVVHQDDTDVNLLRERAAANGYELIFGPSGVYFGPQRLDAAPQPTIMVYAGPATNCLSFNLRDDGHRADAAAFDVARGQGAGVESEVLAPDLPSLGTEPADSAASGLEDFTWRLRRSGAVNPEEARARALGRANELALRVSVDGELDGSLYANVLRIGEPVGVDGVGERHGGIYYVDTVRHLFNTDGYRQSFRLLRNAYGDNLEGAAGVLSGVLGG